jgi:hypothetical protein
MNRRNFLAGAASLPLLAQQKPTDPLAIVVNEVIVPVTVTDDKGRFVGDLDQDDFKVYDEDKAQTIRYFSREPAALEDVSASGRGVDLHATARRSEIRGLSDRIFERRRVAGEHE